MNHKIIMKYPASWHGDMWREGAPFGNGITGGLVYGGIYKEIIMVNDAFLWTGGSNQELPDISHKLPEIRRLLDEKKIQEADAMITKSLQDLGYSGRNTNPLSSFDLLINTISREIFSNYRRVVDMESAEVVVTWNENKAAFRRSTFASRKNNLVFTKYTAVNGTIDTKIAVSFHDTEKKNEQIVDWEQYAKNDMSHFAAKNESVYQGGDYGGACRVFTDGSMSEDGGFIKVSGATEILIVAKSFHAVDRKIAFSQLEDELNQNFDYEKELREHKKLHQQFYSAVEFSLGDHPETANEELLLEAFEQEASDELIEKLYHYGRYLFICSTSDKNTLPCHLTGLFNGAYPCFWAFYMFNVNFELIYWQALTGNLPSFLHLALNYVENFLPDFRENAKKIFGCRGILINSVNTPDSGIFKNTARHIVNWTGGAAWVSQHFWDYYCFTEDCEYLKEHALPFMYETALFYEDFVVENTDGYYDIYPSVSPENTASNVLEMYNGREVETCKNAAMDFALLKELLTNLLKGCEITGMYPEKQEKWREMLSKVRPYMINEDGTVKEWSDDYYKDNHHHRHHSHVYPVFPGCEVDVNHELYQNFKKSEEFRLAYGISDQSSWSAIFMAGIAARMQQGDFALSLFNVISKTSLMNNLFTVHNDWRRMGPIACNDFRAVPFQIDGNIGIPGIINEMLLQSQKELHILPALPEKWRSGQIKGLLARGNILCYIIWNQEGGYVILKSKTMKNKRIQIGSGYLFDNNSAEQDVEICGEMKIKFHKK